MLLDKITENPYYIYEEYIKSDMRISNIAIGSRRVHYITSLDKEKYRIISEDIITEEVIITDERIDHIKKRHPNDFELYSGYMKECIDSPDYIIKDDRPNTALILKEIIENGIKIRLSLRLVTSNDDASYKNSVITFLRIKDEEWRRLIRNKPILYKR